MEAWGLRGVWTSLGLGSPCGAVGFGKCLRETLWCVEGRGTAGWTGERQGGSMGGGHGHGDGEWGEYI